MAIDPLTSIMGAQPEPTDTGFGSYFRSMPLWLAIGGMAHRPEEFFGGYFDYRQGRQQEAQTRLASEQLKAVDKFLLDNFSDADWGDKDIRIQAQRALVERNVPSPVAKQILDNYYVGDNEIMWFDENEMMLHAHRKDKDGNVVSGQKRIPVDMDMIQTNDFYRGLYAAKYPKMRPFLEEKAGAIPRDQQMKEQFLRELQQTGLLGMVSKYGGPNKDPSVFLTYARSVLGFNIDLSSPNVYMMQIKQEEARLAEEQKNAPPAKKSGFQMILDGLRKDLTTLGQNLGIIPSEKTGEGVSGTTTKQPTEQAGGTTLPGKPVSTDNKYYDEKNNRELVPREVNGQVLWFYSDTGQEYVTP